MGKITNIIKGEKKKFVYTVFNQYTLEHMNVKANSDEEAFKLAKRKLRLPLKTAFINKI